MNFPPVVSATEWQAACETLLAKEKEVTRARDALAAERRRLPRLQIEKDYVFDGPDGEARLLDLFEGRRQLLLYHFVFGPNQDEGCDGCSMFVDQIGHLAHLHARDTSFALVSRPRSQGSQPTRTAWVGRSRGSRLSRASSTSTSESLRRRRSRPFTRTASRSGSASSFVTATASLAPTSPRTAASRRSAACGHSST